MPELPEVEAARKAIEDHCIGRKIKRSVIADDSIVIDGVSPSDFEASILGKTIVAARRKGKSMWLELDSPPFPSFQFGMAGAVYIKGVVVTRYKRASVKDSDEWPSKYSKFFVELDDGVELSFTDKRRFARVRLLENPATAPPIFELGPDALLEPMTIDEFVDSLKKKKIGIKALLLDQSFISGIGNWIADEVLYQARIHPLQISSSLPKESCVALHNSIREVVQFAVEVDANCSRFPPSWLFHVRWGKKAGRIDGKKIEFIVAGGRTTAFVPQLQKLHGSQAAKASMKITKPRKDIAKKSKANGSYNDDDDDDDDASESGHKNARAISNGGKGRSRNTPQVAAKRKVIANIKGDGYDHISDADDGTGLKRRSRRAKIPAAATRKLSEGDKSGDDDRMNTSLKRKAGNVSARSKLGESDRNGDEEPSDTGLRRSSRRPRNPLAKVKLGESDKDGDEDPGDNGLKRTTRKPKNPPGKTEIGETGKHSNEDHHKNGDDDKDMTKKRRTAAKLPPAKANSTKDETLR